MMMKQKQDASRIIFASLVGRRRLLPFQSCYQHHNHHRRRHSSTVEKDSRVLLLGRHTQPNKANTHNQPRRFLSSPSTTSRFASIQSWIQDVARTGSLHPPNPILESIKATTETSMERTTGNNVISSTTIITKTDSPSRYLPQFAIMTPHHLESATHVVAKQYRKDLNILEDRLRLILQSGGSTTTSSSTMNLQELLNEIDRINTPLVQIERVASLYTTLASPPDQIQDWRNAAQTVDTVTHDLPLLLYRSSIIYNALVNAPPRSRMDGPTVLPPPSMLLKFHKQGVHYLVHDDTADGTVSTTSDDGDSTGISTINDQRRGMVEQLRSISQELDTLNNRIQRVDTYEGASKAIRLQCVSDMYNIIGLTAIQSSEMKITSNDDNNDDDGNVDRTLNGSTIPIRPDRMVTSPRTELIRGLFPEILLYLQPHLPQRTKLNLEGAGAFLESNRPAGAKSRPGLADMATAEEQRAVWEAKKRMRDCLRLHGVLQGVIDFCDAILGIRVVEEHPSSSSSSSLSKKASLLGWNKNVRLLHLYQKVHPTNDTTGMIDDADQTQNDIYLGTILFDPFRDPYWRTEDAKDLVMTDLFSKNIHQTVAPVVVMALKINPTWDDSPTPMTWTDLRDLLYQFGKAVQLILVQNARIKNMALPVPIDVSELMAHFMEMWIHNDGFLHRLAQLSQSENVIDDSVLDALRKDLKKEKALDIVNTIFLSALQIAALAEFDPRGDETLVSLQSRLAQQYLPKGNMPDSSDLSPLLAVFQEHGIDKKMTAYGQLWSEILSAMVFDAFQRTDLRDRDEVNRLGHGLRNLFLRHDRCLTTKDVEELCEGNVSSEPLKRVYNFGQDTVGRGIASFPVRATSDANTVLGID